MEEALKISLIRFLLIQLVSIVGIFLYDWALFEMVVVYLTESVALYFVFSFNHYVIHKQTRYGFLFGGIILAFSVVLFSGLLLGYSIAAFYITQDVSEYDRNVLNQVFVPKIDSMHLPYVFGILFVLELVFYYIRISKNKKSIEDSYWRAMGRLLFSHILIAAGLALLVLFQGMHHLVVFLFILIKLMVEIFTQEKRLVNTIRHWLMDRAKIRRRSRG